MDMVMVMVMMLVMNDIDLLRWRRGWMLLSLWNMYHLGMKIRYDWLLLNVWKKGVQTFVLVVQETRVG